MLCTQDYDFGKKKAFPFRDQHFFASIDKAQLELGWDPRFDLVEGLKDSWDNDFARGRVCEPADFETDDKILASKGKSVGGSSSAGSSYRAPAPAASAPSSGKGFWD
jgi:hypothetical protein